MDFYSKFKDINKDDFIIKLLEVIIKRPKKVV